MKTAKVAGHSLTLQKGVQYRASRPMMERRGQVFDVTIKAIDGSQAKGQVVPGLDYDAANKLLRAFNNGAVSFTGRIWK